MQKIILLLICLIQALNTYDLYNIEPYLKINIDKTYPDSNNQNYIKLNFGEVVYDKPDQLRVVITFTIKNGSAEKTSSVTGYVNNYLL
jgi:hypothetical protein